MIGETFEFTQDIINSITDFDEESMDKIKFFLYKLKDYLAKYEEIIPENKEKL